jgi:drug/metabolite transporter (DMT)-like permease
MTSRQAAGGFLAIAGVMILVLDPHYEVPAVPPPSDIEASRPSHDSRPIPRWVGDVALVVGAALLFSGMRPRP